MPEPPSPDDRILRILGDPEGYLNDFLARTRAISEQAEALGGLAINHTATVTSTDEAVTVTASASGALQDVTFTSNVRHMSAKSLKDSLMEAFGKAVLGAQEQGEESVQSFLESNPNLRGTFEALPEQWRRP